MKTKRGINWKILIISLVIVYLVAFIGGIFTSSNVNTEWYNSIKPSITPPSWVFPIAWNILFLLIAISLYFSWINAKNKKTKIKIAGVFGINFLLNILWSIIYFSLKNPFYAFIEIIILWISILCMVCTSYKIDKKAGYLLIPYLLWVSFAIVLNYLSI